jgi:hypothetical protein
MDVHESEIVAALKRRQSPPGASTLRGSSVKPIAAWFLASCDSPRQDE